MRKILTGLDIGTSKVCAAIIEAEPGANARILGLGTASSTGINKGFVSNLDKLVDSISKAVQEAEHRAGAKAHHVVANISGASLMSRINEGSVLLSRRGREITRRDVRKVIDTTKHMSVTLDKDLIYMEPQEFIIDDSNQIEDPIGLFGAKLKVKLHVVTAMMTHIQNISKAINYAGYELIDIVPNSVAASSTILEEEDRDNGTVIIDIGGGITEIGVYRDNSFKWIDSVNVGGMDLTSCVSSFYRVPFGDAEMIKKRLGGIAKEDIEKETQDIFDIDSRSVVVTSEKMNSLLKDRFDEITNILHERLKSSGQLGMPLSKIVLTGGSVLLHGVTDAFEARFGVSVKLGRVKGVVGDPAILANPSFAASISLAKYGLTKFKNTKTGPFKGKFFLVDIFYRFRELIEDYF